MGLHIYGSIFHFFSGIDFLFIPRISMYFTFALSSIVIYNLFMRVFKNKNLAILAIFILLTSSLGFIIMIYQYWPSGLAYIQGLFVFYLLYRRLEPFLKAQRPDYRSIKSDIWFNYILITMIFISSLLTHSLIALIILISLLWIYLIYFSKDVRRGFDFLFLCCLGVTFMVFYAFNISTGHLIILKGLFALPWYIMLGFSFALVLGISLLVSFFRRSIIFTKGRFTRLIFNKEAKIYKLIEDKLFKPLCLVIAIAVSVIFFIVNLLSFHLDLTAMFVAIEIALYCIISLWGLYIFQLKPRGKVMWLWLSIFVILMGGGFIFDVILVGLLLYVRIFLLSSVVIVIGFISYIYKLLRLGTLNKFKNQFFLLFILVISLFSGLLITTRSFFDLSSLQEKDIGSIKWYANFSDNKSVIITELGWYYAFIYFNYPYDSSQGSIPLVDLDYVEFADPKWLDPANHIDQNGDNILKKLKESHNNTDVILILTNHYWAWTFFDNLPRAKIDAYYNLTYLNRIFSIKSENGDNKPFYWVI
jgi:hypothetical protein